MRTATRTILTLLLGAVLLLPAFFTGARAEVTLVSAGRHISLRSQTLKSGEYVSAFELFEALGGRVEWDATEKSLDVELAGHRWFFHLFTQFVGVDGDPHNLIYPVTYTKGEILVPIATLAPILDFAHPKRVVWDPATKTLVVETEEFNILKYAVEEKKNGLLLELTLSRPLKFEAFASEGNWLNITLADGRLEPQEFNRTNRRSLVRQIKAYQFDRSAQVSFRFSRDLGPFVAQSATGPNRIQILYEDPSYFPDYPVPVDGQVTTAPDPIDLIVIDPGHGGRDHGAVGRKKRTREKDIVLRIAKYLDELLEKDPAFTAIMTRKDDRFIPLEQRAKIANDAGADLFVSIHANASRKTSPRGSQTFFLARAKNDEARAVAQLENSALRFETDGPQDTSVVNFILLDMIQTEFQRESADLADLVQRQFEKELKIPSRGVDQAGFVVLNRVYMPAILVESAFISNEKEEKLLRKSSFQKKVAKAIYESIKQFKTKYDPAY